MIILFNHVTGRVKLDKDDFEILNTRRTRGQSKKLKVKRDDKDVTKMLPKQNYWSTEQCTRKHCVRQKCVSSKKSYTKILR